MAYENDYLSSLRSAEDKAWERELFAPVTGRDPAPTRADEHRSQYEKQLRKETADLLWMPADPFSHSAKREEEPSQEPTNGDGKTQDETKGAGKAARQNYWHDFSRASSRRAPSSGSAGHTATSGYSGSASSSARSSGASPGRYGGSISYGYSDETGRFADIKDLLHPNFQKAGKRSILAMFLLTAITACVITVASFFIIRTDFFRNNPDFPDLPGYFFGGDDDDYENAYPDGHILTEYGYDYSDIYTPKYIASYENSGDAASPEHKYQELCVVDMESYAGTPDAPGSPDLLISDSDPTHFCLVSNSRQWFSDLSRGFTIMYADSESHSPMSQESMDPPGTSDSAEFFEEIIKYLSDKSEDFLSNHKNARFSKPRTASIGEHNVTYLEVTYKQSLRTHYVDVFSIEKKPLGAAFIVECRYSPGEYEDGKEALSRVYETLTFLQDDFEHIDASRMLFSKSRIYGKENRHAALIDVSDLADLHQSRVYSADHVSFVFGKDTNRPSIELSLSYGEENTISSMDDFETFAEETLEHHSIFYSGECTEAGRGTFLWGDHDAYYISTAFRREEPYNRQLCTEYLISMPDGKIYIELWFRGYIPEDFDPVKFATDHFTPEEM